MLDRCHLQFFRVLGSTHSGAAGKWQRRAKKVMKRKTETVKRGEKSKRGEQWRLIVCFVLLWERGKRNASLLRATHRDRGSCDCERVCVHVRRWIGFNPSRQWVSLPIRGYNETSRISSYPPTHTHIHAELHARTHTFTHMNEQHWLWRVEALFFLLNHSSFSYLLHTDVLRTLVGPDVLVSLSECVCVFAWIWMCVFESVCVCVTQRKQKAIS